LSLYSMEGKGGDEVLKPSERDKMRNSSP